jgi:tripartite-type tricarboxylate transporter receptor subunit TctC
MAPPIHAGRLRGLVQMGAKRSPLLPELATMDDLGYHGAQINGWYGLYAPAKTPKAVTDRFVGEVWHALKDPVTVERLRGLGAEPVGMPQEAFARYVAADIEKYAKLGKRINLKLE